MVIYNSHLSRHRPGVMARVGAWKVFLAVAVGIAASVQAALPGGSLAGKPRYNVLFIIIDDHGAGLQDAVEGTAAVRTPNMQRIAQRGTWFTRAYADAPACCPSRTAFLTGVHTAKSGVYYNGDAYRRTTAAISKVVVLPQHFLKQGYLTAGYGKIAHNRFLQDETAAFTPGYYKMLNRDATHTETALAKFVLPGSEVDFWTQSWNWGILPDDWDRKDPTKLQQDTEFANHTIALLKQKQAQPFFVACGFWRPHVSWYVPKRYYDMYPLDSIALPKGYREDDLNDVPAPARWLATHRGEHAFTVKQGLWKKALQAYYASISYVDEQIGRVLDALESSPHRDNTIVVFAADNGWHIGEKDHWSKFYLSELACRVVFSISVPGAKPQTSRTPVGLIDLYPTLVSLCGLPAPATHTLDGVDLSPILRGERTERGAPVLSTYGPESHSLRNARFRYTRYRNGEEEFYDHDADPYEWKNLAGDPQHAAAKAMLVRALPKVNAPQIAGPSGVPTADANAWKDEAFIRRAR